jgi:ribosomal protein L11 methyltransferase
VAPPRAYPALDVSWPVQIDDDEVGRVLAAISDTCPTGVEERAGGIRLFFATSIQRDQAATVVTSARLDAAVATISVQDDSWAERSQSSLTAVRVGRVIVAPPWAVPKHDASTAMLVRVLPSMGFGTGHHQSTRLCLRLLQALPLTGRSVLDVGTGSGVLALVAWRLGAARAIAVDADAEALASAAVNVQLNGAQADVHLLRIDVARSSSALAGAFDVVTANLTGALLAECAATLAAWLHPKGALIASGFQRDEQTVIVDALDGAGLAMADAVSEDEWSAGTFVNRT